MKRKRNYLKSSSQQLLSSTKTTLVATNLYLPDECWEHVFKFILNNDNDNNNNCSYFESLSIVSKQFLSITNRFKFSLTIICDPPHPYLRQLFQRFTNLNSLDLTGFHGDLDGLLCQISCFPTDNLNIKSLKISNQSKFPANGLRALSKKITTLTSLTCFNIVSLRNNNDDLVLISNYFPLLEQLDLSDSDIIPFSEEPNITDVGVNSMLMALPKLRKVNLSAFNFIGDSLILNLCKNCEFLEELTIKCPYLNHHAIASAVRERPNLKSLSVGWGFDYNISSHFIDSLVSLKGLTCLHVWCSRISDELLSSIAMNGLPLRRLALKYCRGYSYEGIFCLLSKYQRIQHLDLRYNLFLNDQHVVKLSSFLGHLVSINLSYCRSLTDSTLFALTQNCHSLSEIKMKYTSIGKISVEDSNAMMNNVVNPQLKSLRLVHNSCLRDDHIIMLASIFSNLQLLDLSSCSKISKGIGEVLRCCKIKHLNLACCSGVKRLKMNFKNSTLEVLNLSDSEIDDRSLYAISKSCFGLLQLDLVRCHDVTKKGVRRVVEKCTKLREINLLNCCKLDADVVHSIVFIRPSLRKITAPFFFSDSERKRYLRRGCLVC